MKVYDPFGDFETTMRLFRTATPVSGERYFSMDAPYADVLDRDEEIVVTVDLPGIEKKDIRLNVIENHLVIEAERKREKAASVKFRKSIKLPRNVDDSKATATMNNGVLEIRIPKAEKRGSSIHIE